MHMVVSTQWYRIDKADGSLLAVHSVAVVRAAQSSFINAADVIKSGRFSTPFAIYSTGANLTEQEKM